MKSVWPLSASVIIYKLVNYFCNNIYFAEGPKKNSEGNPSSVSRVTAACCLSGGL